MSTFRLLSLTSLVLMLTIVCSGYAQRFGLYRVDHSTQRRELSTGGALYRDIIQHWARAVNDSGTQAAQRQEAVTEAAAVATAAVAAAAAAAAATATAGSDSGDDFVAADVDSSPPAEQQRIVGGGRRKRQQQQQQDSPRSQAVAPAAPSS